MSDYRLPSERSNEAYRRILGWSLIASVFLHGAVVLLWRGGPAISLEEPGGVEARLRESDRALTAVNVAPFRSIEIPAPPEAAVLEEEPVFEPLQIAGSLQVALASPGLAKPSGSGAAGGGTSGSGGSGQRTMGPVPKSLIPEWDPPEEIRGLRVTARVFVSADGRPTGEVELVPPTPDSRFNRTLIEKVLKMEYIPARRDGTAVPAWAEITFIF